MTLRRLAVASVLCAVVALGVRSRSGVAEPARSATPERSAKAVLTPAADRRAPENTFLTFPEWYLVYSPDEYANLLRGGRPSEFPYLAYIGQYWQDYRFLYERTKDDYPFNSDYHVMCVVIGASTTLEYALKWLYEIPVGRVTEATRLAGLTAEDKLAAEVARDYVDFLEIEPWYRFDFLTPLRRIWTDTGLWGPDPLRKWERKYFLTTEYLAKAGYGYVLRQASDSYYAAERSVTTVVVGRLPSAVLAELPKAEVRETFSDGSVLVDLPRYQAFTDCTETLARHGVNFVEIAGNRDAILVTALAPERISVTEIPVLMTQPILTRPGTKRIAFVVPVARLTGVVASLRGRSVEIEHVYDY